MQKEKFFSKITFLLATIGGAIGIANLISFPPLLIKYGPMFIVCYLFFTIIIGIPLMSMEMAVGRNTESDPIHAYRKLGGNNWRWLGVLNVVCCLILFAIFMILAIWIFRYLIGFVFNSVPGDFGAYLTEHPIEIIGIGLFLVAVNVVIVGLGIEKGIEKVSKVLVPIFGMMLVVYAAMNLANPDAVKSSFSATFSVAPDSLSQWTAMLSDALGQAFFSLSLGAGSMLTYAQYLKKEQKILTLSNIIVQTDTLVALACCLFILPLGLDNKFSGTPLFIFVTLSEYFQSLPYSGLLGGAFFLCLSFIVLTMTISVMEPVVSFLADRIPQKRFKLAGFTGAFTMLCIVPLVYSFGASETLTHIAWNKSLFDVAFDLFINVALPIGGLLSVIFIARRWGWSSFGDELQINSYSKLIQGYLRACVFVLTPVCLIVLLIIKVNQLIAG